MQTASSACIYDETLACRAEARSEGDGARLRVASAVAPSALWRDKSRRYGAASSACIYERRMVDQNSASWNRVIAGFGKSTTSREPR
jgi:hypothetical protein